MSKVFEAGMAANWLKSFFDCKVETFSGQNVPVGVVVSVIAFPYKEECRVRLAWESSGEIILHISHCPTGTVVADINLIEWQGAVPVISEKVAEIMNELSSNSI